ncbi:hypothetical protein CLOM_g10608 [Closterium sp. NIES-68]|nr:hypothetical protein CLOM_g10608 [Closterium sp. NIES-68]GJP64223.1 hypothetical protein CLOP_g21235 [Closterium sp. NIES-67]
MASDGMVVGSGGGAGRGEGDSLTAATTALTFHDFLERMKQPAAADLVRPIRNFMMAFMAKDPEPERDSASVQAFYRSIEAAFRSHPLWQGASEDELECSGEALEKYLMTKLFPRAFAPEEEEVERDRRLTTRIAALQTFLQPRHLDVPDSLLNDASLLLAEKDLQKLGSFKAPRDKLVCVLNCCRVINNILLNASITAAAAADASGGAGGGGKGGGSGGKPPGADDFLPVLIYVVVKANPPQLLSSILYIQRYRHCDRLVSEAAYFFTNLASAATFLESLSAAQLSLSEDEFKRLLEAGYKATEGVGGLEGGERGGEWGGVGGGGTGEKGRSGGGGGELGEQVTGAGEEARAAAAGGGSRTAGGSGGAELLSAAGGGGAGSAAGAAGTSSSNRDTERVASLSEISRDKGVLRELVRADASGELARSFRFLYASAPDLSLADVSDLLAEYKDLALRHYALSRVVHGAGLSLPLSFPSNPSRTTGTASAAASTSSTTSSSIDVRSSAGAAGAASSTEAVSAAEALTDSASAAGATADATAGSAPAARTGLEETEQGAAAATAAAAAGEEEASKGGSGEAGAVDGGSSSSEGTVEGV